MVRGTEALRHANAARIHIWVAGVDGAVAELLPLHSTLNEISGAHRLRRSVMLLSTACLGQTGDVLHLIDGVRLWGAELVMRSIVEGTVKFGYLLESPETYTARCIEYRDVLPTLARRRRHSKAQEAIKAMAAANIAASQAYHDLLLTDDQLAEIDAAYPKDMRFRLEKRWGFGALVDSVSKPTGAFGPTARALLHGYSIASDLQHMSYDGVDMPLERDQRAPERREPMELAHAAKLLSDCFHMSFLRVSVLFRFAGCSPGELLAVKERHMPLLTELAQAQSDWEVKEYKG